MILFSIVHIIFAICHCRNCDSPTMTNEKCSINNGKLKAITPRNFSISAYGPPAAHALALFVVSSSIMINNLPCDITIAEALFWRSSADAHHFKGHGALHCRVAVLAMRHAHFEIGPRDSAGAVPQQ